MKALDPAELERVKAALAGEEPKPDPKKETKKRPIARTAAGEKWVDPTLAEWPESRSMAYLCCGPPNRFTVACDFHSPVDLVPPLWHRSCVQSTLLPM